MSAVPNRAPKSGFAAEAQRKVGSIFHVSQGICFIIINVISSPKKTSKSPNIDKKKVSLKHRVFIQLRKQCTIAIEMIISYR